MGGGHGPWGLPGGGEGYSVHAGPAVARDFCLPFVSICPASAFPLGGRCSRFAAQPSALREWAAGEDEGLKFRGPGPWVPLSLPWGCPCQLDCRAVQALTMASGYTAQRDMRLESRRQEPKLLSLALRWESVDGTRTWG